MKVGDGVIIDASKLGMNGGLLVGVIRSYFGPGYAVHLPRRIEREMMWDAIESPYWPGYTSLIVYSHAITATIPNQGHWLGKEMP